MENVVPLLFQISVCPGFRVCVVFVCSEIIPLISNTILLTGKDIFLFTLIIAL